MGKILVVAAGSGLTECIATSQIKEIVAVTGGSEIYFKTTDRGRLKVNDTLANIYAQQNTSLYDLGMVLVTDSNKSRQVILFTHNFEAVGIVQERNSAGAVVGSKIIQENALPDYVVDELIAAIYAQQKAGVNLGMNLVTRTDDNEPIVVMDQHINYITDEPGGTYIILKATNVGRILVDEACAAIHGAQSA